MKKIFLSICFSFILAVQAIAVPREFSSMEEARADADIRNREILQQTPPSEFVPQNDEEMAKYLLERLKVVDVSALPAGERLDKPSSFSKVDDVNPQEKKSFWQKIYDDAIARVSGEAVDGQEMLQQVEYYMPSQEEQQVNAGTQIPQINIKLPDGMTLQVPAYEHIPLFSTQIEVLPNRMLKVYENIVIVANGQKVKEALSRFIKKESPSRHGKIQIMLDDVSVNGTVIPYELTEQNDYYVIRPVRRISLPEGVYVFEFNYLVDRALWDYGDFYEFYWNQTGGHFNLLTTRAIMSVKLPGREPAVKHFALTGRRGNLKDDNAAFMRGTNNTVGFMNLYPLFSGDSMHVLMTVPKVDFTPESGTQKLVRLIEQYGDVALSLLYLLVTGISCLLSWQYIRKKLKFRNIVLPSSILVRALWRSGADNKSVGCALLDLFRKSIIEIEKRDDEIILVRKNSHARHTSKFENKLLGVMFTKKDSICRLSQKKTLAAVKALVYKESASRVKYLGVRLSSMYILFNVLMLLAVEIGLCLWNSPAVLPGIFVLVDILLLIMIGAYLQIKGALWQRILMTIIAAAAAVTAAVLAGIYLHWLSALMLLAGVWTAIIFSRRASGIDAMLKNAVQSAYQMREFLKSQKETLGVGRNFGAHQANIFALDLEDEYPVNTKIKNNYRIDAVTDLLRQIN